MKIILRVYNEIRIGNFSTTIIDIPNNKISVKELKEKIYKKYKIKPSVQRLTYRLGFKKLITLTDSFPLNFFYIKEYSMIFLEVISEEPKLKPEERKKIEKRNLIKYKYMNRLGYFPPDEKTFEKMGISYGYQKRKFSAFHERESKLTEILCDCFGGNCYTSVILNCSTSPQYFEETRNTLLFGQRVKNIENKPKENLENNADKNPIVLEMLALYMESMKNKKQKEENKIIKKLEDEIALLKKRIKQLEEKM